MKNLLVLYFILLFLGANSQNTSNDSLLVEYLNLIHRYDSLQQKLNSIDSLTNLLYESHTKLDTGRMTNEMYDSIVELNNNFWNEVLELNNREAFPQGKPVDRKYYRTTGYGIKTHPIYRSKVFHKGIDIPAKKGTEIIATFSGIFDSEEKLSNSCGKHVIIKNENVMAVFSHLDSLYVSPGEFIKKGQVLGIVGSSGRSTKNHLHYEILINGKNVNPIFTIFEELDKAEIELIFFNNNMSMD